LNLLTLVVAPSAPAMAGDLRMVGTISMGAAVVGLALTCLRRRAAVRCGHGRHRVRIVPRSKPLHSMPDEISLVSYNVLCQRYANSRRFPHVYAQYLEASYRLERIKQELAAFGADIIALQEVTIDRWEGSHTLAALLLLWRA
jgi:CCR4-NOT transcription complex subunit 6